MESFPDIPLTLNSIQSIINLGDKYFNDTEYTQAIDEYNKYLDKISILRGHPSGEVGSIHCLTKKSECLLRLNSFERCINTCNVALTIPSICQYKKTLEKVHYNRAVALQKLGVFDPALKALDNAIAIHYYGYDIENDNQDKYKNNKNSKDSNNNSKKDNSNNNKDDIVSEYDSMRLRLMIARSKINDGPNRNGKYQKSLLAPASRPEVLPSYVLQDAIDTIEVSNADMNLTSSKLRELSQAHVWMDGQIHGQGNIMLALCDSAINRAWSALRGGALRTGAAANEILDLLEICLRSGAIAYQRFGPSQDIQELLHNINHINSNSNNNQSRNGRNDSSRARTLREKVNRYNTSTPLHLLCYAGADQCVQLLLSPSYDPSGASLVLCDKYGWTPLMTALAPHRPRTAGQSAASTVGVILDAVRSRINGSIESQQAAICSLLRHRNIHGMSALHLACADGDRLALQAMLDAAGKEAVELLSGRCYMGFSSMTWALLGEQQAGDNINKRHARIIDTLLKVTRPNLSVLTESTATSQRHSDRDAKILSTRSTVSLRSGQFFNSNTPRNDGLTRQRSTTATVDEDAFEAYEAMLQDIKSFRFARTICYLQYLKVRIDQYLQHLELSNHTNANDIDIGGPETVHVLSGVNPPEHLDVKYFLDVQRNMDSSSPIVGGSVPAVGAGGVSSNLMWPVPDYDHNDINMKRSSAGNGSSSGSSSSSSSRDMNNNNNSDIININISSNNNNNDNDISATGRNQDTSIVVDRLNLDDDYEYDLDNLDDNVVDAATVTLDGVDGDNNNRNITTREQQNRVRLSSGWTISTEGLYDSNRPLSPDLEVLQSPKSLDTSTTINGTGTVGSGGVTIRSPSLAGAWSTSDTAFQNNNNNNRFSSGTLGNSTINTTTSHSTKAFQVQTDKVMSSSNENEITHKPSHAFMLRSGVARSYGATSKATQLDLDTSSSDSDNDDNNSDDVENNDNNTSEINNNDNKSRNNGGNCKSKSKNKDEIDGGKKDKGKESQSLGDASNDSNSGTNHNNSHHSSPAEFDVNDDDSLEPVRGDHVLVGVILQELKYAAEESGISVSNALKASDALKPGLGISSLPSYEEARGVLFEVLVPEVFNKTWQHDDKLSRRDKERLLALAQAAHGPLPCSNEGSRCVLVPAAADIQRLGVTNTSRPDTPASSASSSVLNSITKASNNDDSNANTNRKSSNDSNNNAISPASTSSTTSPQVISPLSVASVVGGSHNDMSNNSHNSGTSIRIGEEGDENGVAINEISQPQVTTTTMTTSSSDEVIKDNNNTYNNTTTNNNTNITTNNNTYCNSMDPLRMHNSSPASMLSMISDTMVHHGKASEPTVLRPILWLAFEDLVLAPLRRVLPSRRRHSEILDGESDLLNFF